VSSGTGQNCIKITKNIATTCDLQACYA